MTEIFTHYSVHRGSPSPQQAVSPNRSPAHSPHPLNDIPQKDGVDSSKARPKGAPGIGTSRGTGIGLESVTGIGPMSGPEIGADGKPGPRNALLQVSEAHLAILPDEDGDT